MSQTCDIHGCDAPAAGTMQNTDRGITFRACSDHLESEAEKPHLAVA